MSKPQCYRDEHPGRRANGFRRRVDPFHHQEDFDSVMLAAMGLKRDTIGGATHMSTGKVGYRMKLFGVKLNDYREARPGTLGGDIARQLMQSLGAVATNRKANVRIEGVKKMVRAKLRSAMPTKKQSRSGTL